jgi:hypothetical protein
VKPSHQKLGWGKYCSIECRTKSQFVGDFVGCSSCKKKIYRSKGSMRHSKSGTFFCNKACQVTWENKQRVGEKHPNWINGINTYRNILLRSGVKQVCNSCNFNDKRVLVAHHIDHNRNNNDQSNLVWMCMNCHYLLHHDEKFEDSFKISILKK